MEGPFSKQSIIKNSSSHSPMDTSTCLGDRDWSYLCEFKASLANILSLRTARDKTPKQKMKISLKEKLMQVQFHTK